MLITCKSLTINILLGGGKTPLHGFAYAQSKAGWNGLPWIFLCPNGGEPKNTPAVRPVSRIGH